MIASRARQGVEYGICGIGDLDDMVRLLAEVFTENDPPALAVGLTAPEFETFVRLFCPKVATDGLTIVGRSMDTGEMVGALFTEDSASPMPTGFQGLSHRFDPIFDILGQLDEEYRGGVEVRPGERLHLFLLGVGKHFTRRGVAQTLVHECVENGARKGYRLAVTEATNLVSQHVFRKQGFTDRVRRSYSSYRHEGRATFRSIESHVGPILMDRTLNST